MLIVSGTMRVDPDRVDDLLRAAEPVMRLTRAEEGCLAYHFAADGLEPGVVRVYEQWTDKAALDSHLLQPHTDEFRRALGGLGPRQSDVTVYEATPLGRPEVPPLPPMSPLPPLDR